MLHGFDVSAFQGNTVPSCDFIFVKATEGSGYTSSRFAAQWASAKTRARVRGAYHFARPEASSGASQADRLLARANAVPGEMLCLDLEASQLSQSQTNAWAKAFGDRLRARAPGITTVAYLGSGYASSGTGKGLADHFDYWWYPQYPSTAATSTWPSSLSPWLPSGITTGWARPHIWQFADNFGGTCDANISTLTTDQLASGATPQPTPQEEDVYGGQIPAGKGQQVNVSFPRGSLKALGLVQDNSLVIDGVIAAEPQAQVRYAIHRADGSWQTGTATVGSADGGKDHSPKTVVSFTSAATVDYVSFVRLDAGTRPIGWDMS
jgi:hypothetical protein